MRLPNLDDVSLSLAGVSGIVTIRKGRFLGELTRHDGFVDEDVVNMLLEIPSGLHSTEAETRRTARRHPQLAARPAEACGETLVKLLSAATFDCTSHPFHPFGLI